MMMDKFPLPLFIAIMPVRAAKASPFLSALALAAAPAPAADAPEWPADAVLLFVAGWCAPCHAELAEVAELSTAAAPRRLLVVPADRSRTTAAMVAPLGEARVWRDAAAVRRIGSGAYGAGLPVTLVTDAEGRVCAEHRRVLRPGDLAALAARCRAR